MKGSIHILNLVLCQDEVIAPRVVLIRRLVVVADYSVSGKGNPFPGYRGPTPVTGARVRGRDPPG